MRIALFTFSAFAGYGLLNALGYLFT